MRTDIDETLTSMVEKIKEKTSITKSTEIISNGISLLYWALNQVENGKELASWNRDDLELETFHMPMFDRVKVKKSKDN
jgi:ferric iron reductase protein FhuF